MPPEPTDAPVPEPPTLAPGYYRRPGSARWWRADELAVVWFDGQWCCVPRVALAAVPEQEQHNGGPARMAERD